MFSKSPDPTSMPAVTGQPSRPAASSTKSVLAQDLRITGEISSTGTIEVLGEIEGNLTARGLIVGAEGRMNGTVAAETVEVKGKLDGRVTTQAFRPALHRRSGGRCDLYHRLSSKAAPRSPASSPSASSDRPNRQGAQ